MTSCDEGNVKLLSFVTSAVCGKWWSASSSGHLITAEKTHDTLGTGHWMDLRVGPDFPKNRTSSVLLPALER